MIASTGPTQPAGTGSRTLRQPAELDPTHMSMNFWHTHNKAAGTSMSWPHSDCMSRAMHTMLQLFDIVLPVGFN